MLLERLVVGLAALGVLALPALALEVEVTAGKKSIIAPAVNAKKFSKKYPIEVGLALAPGDASKVFDGARELECLSFFHRDSDRVKMKAKLTRTVMFINEDGQETEVELGSKKAKDTFIRFEFPLPQVDLSELGSNLEAVIYARLNLLNRKRITRVELSCEIVYE